MNNNADNATAFVAIATFGEGDDVQREAATFPPSATVAEIFAAFFPAIRKDQAGLGRRFWKAPRSIELLPDRNATPTIDETLDEMPDEPKDPNFIPF